jgi:hypothetical protein
MSFEILGDAVVPAGYGAAAGSTGSADRAAVR